MKCDKCKQKDALIHIESVGDFCLDCHNKKLASIIGTDLFEEFSKVIYVYDADGVLHQFEIYNMLLPFYVIWKADEVDGGYQFEVMTSHEEEQQESVKHLHQKILTGLGHKTLVASSEEGFIGNAVQIGRKQHGLNRVGTCRIEYGTDDFLCLVVDGIEIDIQDFGRMLSAYEGFVLDYQIRDRTDEVLGKDMILRHFNIRCDDIQARFEKTLRWFLEDNFLSYKRQNACEEALVERVDELELLFNYGVRDEAIKLGEQIKKRLLEIDHDTDDFPSWIIDQINRVLE